MRRFSLFLSVVLVALALQIRSLEIFGNTVDIVFVTLIVFAFWASLTEHALVTLITVSLLNWRPGIAPELIFFALFPLALLLARSYMPWRRGFTVALAILIGIAALYLIAIGPSVFSLHNFLWKDMVGSMIIGLLLFWLLGLLYHPKARGFGVLYALPR